VVVCSCSSSGIMHEGTFLREALAAGARRAAAGGVCVGVGGRSCFEFTHVLVDEAGQVRDGSDGAGGAEGCGARADSHVIVYRHTTAPANPSPALSVCVPGPPRPALPQALLPEVLIPLTLRAAEGEAGSVVQGTDGVAAHRPLPRTLLPPPPHCSSAVTWMAQGRRGAGAQGRRGAGAVRRLRAGPAKGFVR
jgi:hypothetical protein